MPTKKKPAATKKPAGKTIKAKKETAPAKAAASKGKSAPSKAKAEPAKKVAPSKIEKSPAPKKAALSKGPEGKGKKAKAPLKPLEKSAAKFNEDELDEEIEFQGEEGDEEIVSSRPSRKPKPRFDVEAVPGVLADAEIIFEEGEGGEDALDAGERVELEEEDVDEDTEGPPPWWKDDPTGIEPEGDEAGGRAQFDDSDEWSEDDEDWASKRGSFDDVEDPGDEEDSW